MAENYPETHFLRLPSEVLEHILKYLTFDTISNLRQVCKYFNQMSQQSLNLGFSKVDKYHAKIQKLVKTKLPRRESERRNHPLAKHVNALSAIETRLSLMNMTYMKYIDMGLCCFIPGRVLDEMFRVLRALEDICTQPRTHELLQELRDISSMAMEHFEEKIVPVIKKKNPPVTIALSTSLPIASPAMTPGIGGMEYNEISWSTPPTPPVVRQPHMRQELNTVRTMMRTTSSSVLAMKKEVNDGNKRSSAQQKKLLEMEKKLQDQSKIINEQSKKMTENEAHIFRMRQTLFEYDLKFSQLRADMTTVKGKLGLEDTNSNSSDAIPFETKDISLKSEVKGKIEKDQVNELQAKLTVEPLEENPTTSKEQTISWLKEVEITAESSEIPLGSKEDMASLAKEFKVKVEPLQGQIISNEEVTSVENDKLKVEPLIGQKSSKRKAKSNKNQPCGKKIKKI